MSKLPVHNYNISLGEKVFPCLLQRSHRFRNHRIGKTEQHPIYRRGKRISVASSCHSLTLCHRWRLESSLAFANIASQQSTPKTSPVGPTASTSLRRFRPVPQPTSSTLSPGLSSNRFTALAPTFNGSQNRRLNSG